MTSMTPPSVSASSCAASISAIIAAAVASENARTGLASIRSRSPGPGTGSSSGASTAPIATTCETISTSSACRRNAFATVPSTTRAAVSRALARSSTGRASSNPYLVIPARSAWPGRGRVSGALRARFGDQLGVDGIGGHDRLPLRPLGVADPHRDGPALGQAVPDPADHLELVGLERHPRAAPVPELAPGQLGGQLLRGDLHAGDHALEHGDQRGTVGLPGGDPAQHPPIIPRPPHGPRAPAAATSRPARSIDGPCGTAPPLPRRTSTATARTPLDSAASTPASASASQDTAAEHGPERRGQLDVAPAHRRGRDEVDGGVRRDGDDRAHHPACHGVAADGHQEQQRHRQRRQGQRVGQAPGQHVDRPGRDREPAQREEHRQPAHGDGGGPGRAPHRRDAQLAPRRRHPRAAS